MKPLLTLDNIFFSYNKSTNNRLPVLKELNLSVYNGEHISIIGPNGCGKSTLLAIICGLLTPEHGCIQINRSHIGHMLNNNGIFEWRTTYRNIYNCYNTSGSLSSANEQNFLLPKTPISHSNISPIQKDSDASSTCNRSNCLKRRAALIKTLIYEPDLLLLDEPFLPFDPEGRLLLTQEIKCTLSRELKTALLATNNLEEAILFGDKIILLSNRPAFVMKEIPVPASLHELSKSDAFRIQDYKTFIQSEDYQTFYQEIQNTSFDIAST